MHMIREFVGYDYSIDVALLLVFSRIVGLFKRFRRVRRPRGFFDLFRYLLQLSSPVCTALGIACHSLPAEERRYIALWPRKPWVYQYMAVCSILRRRRGGWVREGEEPTRVSIEMVEDRSETRGVIEPWRLESCCADGLVVVVMVEEYCRGLAVE